MKPANNGDNWEKCICGNCPLFRECNQEKNEKIFCARKKSECEMDAKKMCICGGCTVYNENSLSRGYFCINEIQE